MLASFGKIRIFASLNIKTYKLWTYQRNTES